MITQRHNPAYRLAHLQKTKLSAETRGAVFQLQKRILLKEPVRKKCALRRREEDSEMSKIEKTKGVLAAAALTVFSLAGSSQVFAMDAPGSGDPRWEYREDHHWYYQREDGSVHTGWLSFEDEWYWFDSQGRMAESGFHGIDGKRYYFFSNGHMAWNQYLDLSYLNEDGQPDEAHDIGIAGSVTPEGEAKDLLTDYLYQIPRSWLSRFAEEDWQFLFYPNKKFFEAPDTSQGIYYVYHSTDTYYKKVKFTRPEAVLRAFGEYVGFASGCYQKDSRRMEALWKESKQLQPLLKIPDIYSGDAQVYFGSLFAAYVDEETRDEVLKHSPEAGRILDEILASAETEEAGQRMKERLEKRRQEDLERLWWENTEKGYGPGVPGKQKKENASSEAAKELAD